MPGRRIDVNQSGKLWLVLAGVAVVAYGVWQLSGSIANGSIKAAVVLGAGFVAFFVAGKIADDWRSGVYFFFTWLLFEDLVRKYAGNNMSVYFGKDVLVLVTYMCFFVDRTKGAAVTFKPPFRHVLSLFFLLALVQMFNPLSPSIFYGILGMKLQFLYVPLMFVAYAMMRKEGDLRRFLVVTMGCGGVIALIGILQTIWGLEFLNPRTIGSDIDELGHLSRMTHSGISVPRPVGVFVSAGRFSDFLEVAFIIGIGTAGYLLLRSRRGRRIVFPSLSLVALATVLAAGRGAFMQSIGFSALLFAVMLWGAPPDAGSSYRLFKAIRRSVILAALLLALATIVFPDVIGARLTFYQESAVPGAEYSEVGSRIWYYPVQEMKKAFSDRDWLMGHGTGTASLGAQYVARIMSVPASNTGVENGYGNILLELGILGPILYVIWTSSLILVSCLVALQLKGTWAFPVAISIVLFSFFLLFFSVWGTLTLYEDFVNNAFFWFLIGVLFRLPGLVREDADQQRLAALYSDGGGGEGLGVLSPVV